MSSQTKPTVAIVGINGTLGERVITAILSETFKSHFSLPIRLVTGNIEKTKAISSKFTEGDVRLYAANVATGDGLDAALERVDVVVNLLSDHVTHDRIADAAARAGVKLYFASAFGGPTHRTKHYQRLFENKHKHCVYARSLGLKCVSLENGSFIEYVLTQPYMFGINSPTAGNFEYFGDRDALQPVTSLDDVAKSLASLALKPPAEIPDDVFISGDFASPRTLREAYQRATGVLLKDDGKPLEAISVPAQEILAKGITSFEDLATVLKAYLFSGEMIGGATHNEFVSKGWFEFRKLDEVAAVVLKKEKSTV